MSDVTNRSATPSLTGSVVKSISRFSGAVVMTWVVAIRSLNSEALNLQKFQCLKQQKFNQASTLKYFLNNSLRGLGRPIGIDMCRQYDLVGVES